MAANDTLSYLIENEEWNDNSGNSVGMSADGDSSSLEPPSKSFFQSPLNVGLVVVFVFILFLLIYATCKRRKGAARMESHFPIPIFLTDYDIDHVSL